MSRHTVYICTNAEAVCFHVDSGIPADYQSRVADAYWAAASAELGGADVEPAGAFRDWNGGKFFRAGDIIGGDRYGYRCGLVAALGVNLPAELRDLIDRAADAGERAATSEARKIRREIGEEED